MRLKNRRLRIIVHFTIELLNFIFYYFKRRKKTSERGYFSLLGLDELSSTKILRNKKVGIIGTGGIGSTAALLLAAAGIGKLVISDGDKVEESNLTRSILFSESDIGDIKVNAAKKILAEKNQSVLVDNVIKAFTEPELIYDHFSDCDVILLSADSPKELHEWINEACIKLDLPYLTAGYTEIYGVIGPFVIPGKTSCFECSKIQSMESANQQIEINKNLQAASYGPLNLLVASIATNEIIRNILDQDVTCYGSQILIDSTTYEIHKFNIPKVKECSVCSNLNQDDKNNASISFSEFDRLATIYKDERKFNSFNSFLLDELIISLITKHKGRNLLDVGCATGEISRRIAQLKYFVTAVDISTEMLKSFRELASTDELEYINIIYGDFLDIDFESKFDYVLLNLILDHIEEPLVMLQKCHEILNDDGVVIITIPHPFKDSGRWIKHKKNGSWSYKDFIVDNYFYEGPIDKSRENKYGDVVIEKITSHKRTLETYFKLIKEANLMIIDYFEPKPEAQDDGVLAEKSIRVPYFSVFSCKKIL
jgi:bacteriocin biosynthesis cyclodehydratase domain-containing protein